MDYIIGDTLLQLEVILIKYLFTNNELIGSKLISRATKRSYQTKEDTPSHFAILIADRWVLHSNFSNGVNIQPYYFFKQNNKIVESLRQHCDHKSDTECILFFDGLVKKAYGTKYDFPAIMYFTYRIILKYLFNAEVPTKNKWEVADKWFCNELFELVLNQDLSMKTPNDLMWLLLEHPDYISCETFA